MLKRLDVLEPLIDASAGDLLPSVYGIVDKVTDGIPHCVRRWKGTIGKMEPTDEQPTIFLIEKLEPLILKHKKYKCCYGGRAGTKSIMAMDVMAGEVNSSASGVFCLRDKMKSIDQSIFRGMKSRINSIGLTGFKPLESKWRIDHKNGGVVSFGGMANIRDMKSLFQYKFFLSEEAAKTSQETIDVLGPTLRGVDGAELWYLWNPESSEDPINKEYIIPYQSAIDRQGYYEDDYHLIIKVGKEDNPWFDDDQSLREEYEKDCDKLADGRMSKARFAHIWKGSFNDGIEDGLIGEDWFDACIDAHEKLNFRPTGAKFASFDVADEGKDSKAYCLRHGSVFLDFQEMLDGDAYTATDWACEMAIHQRADYFTWDGDGMGALIRKQVGKHFTGKHTQVDMFRGSESPDRDTVPYDYGEDIGISSNGLPITIGDVFRNKRAQYYGELKRRIYNTYRAVEYREPFAPDDMISFSSDIKCLQKLRAEICRIPVKKNYNGKFELYTKADMVRLFKIPSPNLTDAAMMSLRNNHSINRPAAKMPAPIRTMGRR